METSTLIGHREDLTHKEPIWRAPWEFAVHALVGLSIFFIIAVVAVGLGAAIHQLEVLGGKSIDSVIILGLKCAEYGLLSCDLVLFCVFLYRATKRAIERL